MHGCDYSTCTQLVAFCKEKDIYLLSDETYREMYLEVRF
jgi:aspartate/methionine/tyrosine aminotransferase